MKRFFIVLGILLVVIGGLALLISIYGTEDQQAATPVTTPVQHGLHAADTDPSQGPRNGKVTVITMSSFTCPACKSTSEEMDQLRALYPDQVRLVWKDLPDTVGTAYQAAIAARCAQEQGKFWQFHDVLFQKQDFLATRSLYTLWAQALGMLSDVFDNCLDKQQTKPLVDANINEALQQGVKLVPYVQIGDMTYEGPQTLTVYRTAVDQALGMTKK